MTVGWLHPALERVSNSDDGWPMSSLPAEKHSDQSNPLSATGHNSRNASAVQTGAWHKAHSEAAKYPVSSCTLTPHLICRLTAEFMASQLLRSAMTWTRLS